MSSNRNRNTNGVVNGGLKAAAAKDAKAKAELTRKRTEQVELALTEAENLPQVDAVRLAFAAVLNEFLTAQPKNTPKGKLSATEVAVRRAKELNTKLFYGKDTASNAEKGVKAAKAAIYRAGQTLFHSKKEEQNKVAKPSKASTAISAMPKPSALAHAAA